MADKTPTEFNVGIFVQHMAEVLDFCGPFEVFNNVNFFQQDVKVNVFTISETREPVNAQGLSINPTYSIEDHPKLDILLIPGGGTAALLKNEKVVNWIKEVQADIEYLLSVCTGSLIYAKADLLDGLTITSHFSAIDMLRKMVPKATVDPSKRYIDNGRIITSAGISAGIDMSLHMVERLWGLPIAIEIAKNMEYNWLRTEENVNLDHLKPIPAGK